MGWGGTGPSSAVRAVRDGRHPSSTRCYIYVLIKKEDQEAEVHANFDQFDRGRRFHRCRPNHSLSIQILCTLKPIR